MKRKLRPLLSVVAVIGCLLAVSFGAELYNGAISNLLAPFYGSAQTKMNGDIGIPVEATVSADGYTLTADAIIRDDDSEAIVYTFTRDDGQPIPEDVTFEQFDGNDLKIVRMEETPHQVKIVVTKPHSGIPLGRITMKKFSGLVIEEDGVQESTLLADGPWELTFVLRYRNSTVKISDDITVQGELGTEYVIQRIVLSPLSIHMDVTAPVPQTGSELMGDFTVFMRRTDGTMLPVLMALGAGWNDEDETVLVELDEYFELPAFGDEIEALVICDTDILIEK